MARWGSADRGLGALIAALVLCGLAMSPALAAPKVPPGKGPGKPAPTVSPTPTVSPSPTTTPQPTVAPTATPTAPTEPTSSPTAGPVGAKSYYLALGDSIAQGGSPANTPGAAYPYTLAASLPGTTLINYACSGESSTTLVSGSCPYPSSIAHPYTGTQLAAAVAFIRARPGAVSPVTLQVGANDLFSVTGGGCGVTSSAPQALATFEDNLRTAVGQISTALAGTGDFVLLNMYHPYQNDCAPYPQSREVFEQLNARIASVAAEHGLPVTDVFRAFGSHQTPPNPLVCELTFMCERNQDVHPTTAGQDAIAGALRSVLRY